MKKLNPIPPLSKGTLAVWWICRGLLLVWGIGGLMYGYTTMFVQATAAIIFTHLWDLFQLLGGKSFITKMPAYLQTELNIFACFGCVVGTTLNNFTEFDLIDVPEHMYAGFLACSFGFVLCDIMQGRTHRIKPSVQALFGMAVGVAMMVGWEFYEFTMDRLYGYNLQHALPNAADGALDTMIDLILGSAGALIGMFVEAFRRVGILGADREERKAEYRRAREEAKAEKLRERQGLHNSGPITAEAAAKAEYAAEDDGNEDSAEESESLEESAPEEELPQEDEPRTDNGEGELFRDDDALFPEDADKEAVEDFILNEIFRKD